MISDTQRTVLRVGAVLVLLGAPVLLLIGLVNPWSTDVEPLRVQPGTAVALPAPGFWGDSEYALYGRVPAGEDTPSEKDLGCVQREEDGSPASPVLVSDLSLVPTGPRTVDGQELRQLLTVTTRQAGWTLTCDGTAATAAEPLYLLGVETLGGMVRWFVFGAAALCLVFGAAGLAVLGVPRRRA